MENEELNLEENEETVVEASNPTPRIYTNRELDENPGLREQLNPTTTQNSFAAPFNSQVGNSSVDLTQGNNEDTMMNEYREWYYLGRDRKFGIFPYNNPEFQEERNL